MCTCRKTTKMSQTTKSLSAFNPGDVVRVVYNQGCLAHQGQLAIVVSPEEFPAYLKDMLNSIDEKDLYHFFIAVRWVPSLSYPNKPEDGFYSKARFEKVENVAKG